MKPLHRHYKLTTERNGHSFGSGPLGSGPIGPGSGYSVMPSMPNIIRLDLLFLKGPVCLFNVS